MSPAIDVGGYLLRKGTTNERDNAGDDGEGES